VKIRFGRWQLILASLAVSQLAGVSVPTLDEALEAPAADVAQAYLSTRTVLKEFIPYVEMGVVQNLHVGGERITAKNVSSYRAAYKKRLRIYKKAIQRRGVMSLQGTYLAEATESCARAGSTWMAMVQNGDVTQVRVNQDNIEATFEVIYEHKGESRTLQNRAAVVESSIAIADSMNSDSFSIGELRDGELVIQPDVRVLDSWPEWAGRPERDDIIACAVFLSRIGEEPIS
jgi:hypothetical protein